MASYQKRIKRAFAVLDNLQGGQRRIAEILEAGANNIAKAQEMREMFVGRNIDPRLVRTKAPDPGGVLVLLGDLHSVCYRARKGRSATAFLYEHEFETPLPELAMNADRRLVICGGGYDVTDRGIER